MRKSGTTTVLSVQVKRGMEIQENELYLWYTEVYTLTLQQADSILALLSVAEHKRYEGLQNAAKRNEFLVSRYLLRTALAMHIDRQPEEFCFTCNQFGKPSLLPVSRFQFNCSNTRKLAVCLIGSSGPVGVDIEQWNRAAEVMDVGGLCFSEGEMQALYSLTPALRSERVLTLWTLKEAYLKAIGIGLAAGLDKVEFHYDNTGKPELRVDPGIDTRPERWNFSSIDIMGHRVTLFALFPFHSHIRNIDGTMLAEDQANTGEHLRSAQLTDNRNHAAARFDQQPSSHLSIHHLTSRFVDGSFCIIPRTTMQHR